MDYIAVLDYEHLDNGVFLTAFARALTGHSGGRNGLIIHGESAYTDRLIQTGMMREEARIRAIKDLNHRLIALLADHGIATIGLNGYQRGLISEKDGALVVDRRQLHSLPEQPLLLLSNLIRSESGERPKPIPLRRYAAALKTTLGIGEIVIFNLDDSAGIFTNSHSEEITKEEMDSDFRETCIPLEFREIPFSFRLVTADAFTGYPEKKGTTLIRAEDR